MLLSFFAIYYGYYGVRRNWNQCQKPHSALQCRPYTWDLTVISWLKQARETKPCGGNH